MKFSGTLTVYVLHHAALIPSTQTGKTLIRCILCKLNAENTVDQKMLILKIIKNLLFTFKLESQNDVT